MDEIQVYITLDKEEIELLKINGFIDDTTSKEEIVDAIHMLISVYKGAC